MAGERVDLRTSACFPYIEAFDQGDEQSCVVQAFAFAAYCLKVEGKRAVFPRSGLGFPMLSEIFRGALEASHDPSRGTSFQATIQFLMERHREDLEALGWRLARVPNDVRLAKHLLRQGGPIVVGYQVNSLIAEFHSSSQACERYGYLLPSFRADPHAVSAHAVVLLGFDDAVGSFLARNSWGKDWGVEGHFLVRYEDFACPEHFTDAVGFERRVIPAGRQPAVLGSRELSGSPVRVGRTIARAGALA